MSTRAIIRNRSVEGEFINTNRNFGFKKSAALNQWSWGPRNTATVFDSVQAARTFALVRIKKPVTIVPLEK